jgi:hypothetical protein
VSHCLILPTPLSVLLDPCLSSHPSGGSPHLFLRHCSSSIRLFSSLSHPVNTGHPSLNSASCLYLSLTLLLYPSAFSICRSNGRLCRRESTSFFFPLAVRKFGGNAETMLFGGNFNDEVAYTGGDDDDDDYEEGTYCLYTAYSLAT